MRLYFIFIFLTICITTFGQQTDTIKEGNLMYINESIEAKEDSIYDSRDCEEKVTFPGGDIALLKFVAYNCRYPKEAQDKKVQGTVFVKFVITKSGDIGQVTILNSVDPILDEEAKRVISILPKWTPAKKDGKLVNCWFIVPVKFKLD
jgi:TonB family protein